MNQGYIREEKDIKYLILYSLTFMPFAISKTDLFDVVAIDDGFTYFDFSAALSGLCESNLIGCVQGESEPLYVLTPKGGEIVAMLEKELRASVRDKAENAAVRVIRKIRRSSSIKTGVVENEDGTFSVNMRISDESGDLFNATVLVFTKRQSIIMENNFKRNAEEIYKKLTKDLLIGGE